MKNELHLVLGGSGAMGRAVISALQSKQKKVIAIERTKKVNEVETIFADLTNKQQTIDAIKNATHVYLCVGLPYSTKVWQNQWPKIVESVVEACSKNNAKLIFLDNIYMYGPSPLLVPFNEQHPQNTTTAKGLVRKQVADFILDAHKSKKIEALIGRSSDFYGPFATNSVLYIQFIENILNNNNPTFIGKPGFAHTYAFTIDSGRALVELALKDSAYGQVWHLPVEKPIQIEEVNKIINSLLSKDYKVTYIPRILLRILSIFPNNNIKEVLEMLYQFDNPYIMDDSKFRKEFPNFKTTSYKEGLKLMIQSFTSKKNNS